MSDLTITISRRNMVNVDKYTTQRLENFFHNAEGVEIYSDSCTYDNVIRFENIDTFKRFLFEFGNLNFKQIAEV